MKNRKQDTNSRYIDKLEKHMEKSNDSAKYASDRFDVLIVTISTTALVITIGFVKNFIGDDELIDTSLLKTSWLFFVITIIANLTSQLTSYYSHKMESKITRNLIRIERNKEPFGNQIRLDIISRVLDITTQILNAISFVTLFIAIIVIVVFYSNNI